MFRRYSFLALCVCLAVAQGCRHHQRTTQPNLDVSYEVSPQPTRVGEVTVTIKMKDGAAKPIAGAHVKLEANMSHAGMASVTTEASEVGPGRYQAHMKLTMAGDWQVLVLLTLPDDRELDQQFEIKGVAPA